MHFKGKYEKVKRGTKKKPITQFETILDEDFVNNLPLKIEDLVKEVCNETNQVIPSWLNLK